MITSLISASGYTKSIISIAYKPAKSQSNVLYLTLRVSIFYWEIEMDFLLQAMSPWPGSTQNKKYRPEADFLFLLVGEISPNPIDRRFHLRRRTCRCLFFFLLVLLLRLGFRIFDSEQIGQICLIGHRLAILVLDFVVFCVCRLFLGKQLCVLCPQLLE